MREKLAELMHEIWAGWTDYVFKQCSWDRESDSKIIPGHCVERWTRQIVTSYDELSEEEKDSDRKVADKVLALIAASQFANIIENTNPVDDLRCEGCGKVAESLTTWTIDEKVWWLCNECGACCFELGVVDEQPDPHIVARIMALPETEL